MAGASTASDKRGGGDYGSSSGSEEDEDFVASLPMSAPAKAPTGPRMSVSAEAFGKFNKVVAYVPPVHNKSS